MYSNSTVKETMSARAYNFYSKLTPDADLFLSASTGLSSVPVRDCRVPGLSKVCLLLGVAFLHLIYPTFAVKLAWKALTLLGRRSMY